MTEVNVEENISKAVKAREALWGFTKVVLSIVTYIGLHGLLIHQMVDWVTVGTISVGFAVTYSVVITAVIHFYALLATL